MTKQEKLDRKNKIKAIAIQLVIAQVERGELDDKDKISLKAVTEQAVKEAKNVYDAVQEFLS